MTDIHTIKTSELRYRRLFEAAQDGILLLDAETGAITDVNPYLIQMLGYSQGRRGMSVSPIILDHYHGIRVRCIDAVLRDQLLADLGLERCEFEVSGLVAFDHEIDRGVAKITNAVEKNDRSHR